LRILITGITGMAGSHLADYLLTMEQREVHGTYRHRSKLDNIEHIQDRIDLELCDMTDSASVRKVVKKCQPHVIFHLAAQSYVPASWNAPSDTIYTNVIGEVNLLEAARDLDTPPTIVIAGTSEEYGLIEPKDLPIREKCPLRPLSPYGVSKVAQEMLALQYHRSYGLRTIVTRAFNHEGPRRGDVFVTSSFAKQIVQIEKHKKEPLLRVGDLTAKRDWSDVRDVVKAYWLASQWCYFGEVYNIASGKSLTVGKMLDMLRALSKAEFTVYQDPARMRPSDIPELRGDSTKFRDLTGWKPEIPLRQTLKDLLDYWRERI